MKNLFVRIVSAIILLSGLAPWAFSQEIPSRTIDWHFSVEKKGDIYQIIIDAVQLEEDWHFWTIDLESEFLIATKVVIEDSALFDFTSDLQVDGIIEYIEDEIVGKAGYYKSDARFVQDFKLRSDSTSFISGYIIYQSCNNTLCKPPEKLTFNLNLP